MQREAVEEGRPARALEWVGEAQTPVDLRGLERRERVRLRLRLIVPHERRRGPADNPLEDRRQLLLARCPDRDEARRTVVFHLEHAVRDERVRWTFKLSESRARRRRGERSSARIARAKRALKCARSFCCQSHHESYGKIPSTREGAFHAACERGAMTGDFRSPEWMPSWPSERRSEGRGRALDLTKSLRHSDFRNGVGVARSRDGLRIL